MVDFDLWRGLVYKQCLLRRPIMLFILNEIHVYKNKLRSISKLGWSL